MISSTTRKLTRFQFAATLLGALAVAALAPTATAYATDNQPGGPDSVQCHYTDSHGDDIPIDEGSDVFADGTIVSCRDGKIVITTAPKTGAAGAQQQQPQAGSVLSPASETPKKGPVVRNVPVVSAKN
jgi:hypothetical protein